MCSPKTSSFVRLHIPCADAAVVDISVANVNANSDFGIICCGFCVVAANVGKITNKRHKKNPKSCRTFPKKTVPL